MTPNEFFAKRFNATEGKAETLTPNEYTRQVMIYNDYLHRKAVFNALNDIGGCGAPPESWADGWDKAIDAAIEAIEKLPNADVEPVKHGHWIDFYGNYETAECSVCEELYEVSDMRESNRMLFEAFSQYYKYCPHCGAKMDGEESG